jgi:hypothetical protein
MILFYRMKILHIVLFALCSTICIACFAAAIKQNDLFVLTKARTALSSLQLREAKVDCIIARALAVNECRTAIHLRGGSDDHFEVMQGKLFKAIQESDVDEVAALVSYGAKVNALCPFLDEHLEPTALHYASFNNNSAIVAKLIELGAQVNLPNKRGYTALHFAALMGHVDVCRTLVQFGADLNATDSLGDQPVDRAEQCEDGAAAAAFLLDEMQQRGISRGWRGYKPLIQEVLSPPLPCRRCRRREGS